MDAITVVRCPRCGSMDAESVEPIHAELDRMACATCGHTAVCDDQQIKDDWNERASVERARTGFILPSVRFESLWRELGADGPWYDPLERLRAAHAEEARAYHGASHVSACLRLLDDPEVKALADRPCEVEAAIWFHDAVYDTHATDNEERSARLAEVTLSTAGVPALTVDRIAAYVRATKGHDATTGDGVLVVDVDLSILGESPEVFARFEEAIRKEYAWVPEDAYASGRAAVLRRFLERDRVYGTDLFRTRYESQARENLSAAVAKWSAAGVQ